MILQSNRAGSIYKELTGYSSYLPNDLNTIKIEIDDEIIDLLLECHLLLGRLNGISDMIPNKDIFLSAYVEKESVLSSQIEGTQISLTDVLKKSYEDKKDIDLVVNYIKALNYGIDLLNDLPLSVRFLKNIHKILLENTRGSNKNPGELRNSQNWIGGINSNLNNAKYIPPSVDNMNNALSRLEKYINQYDKTPILIKAALIHYQFETIHPFLDGNGRIGRILIPLYLMDNKLLKSPLIYPSLYLKRNKEEYYNLLMDVRFNGNYEKWIKFFIKGMIESVKSSIDSIERIVVIKEDYENKIKNLKNKNKDFILDVLRFLYNKPYFDSVSLKEKFNISKPTALSVINTLLELDIIKKINDKKRYVIYRLNKYTDIIESDTEI